MELIKSATSRTRLGEFGHVALNLLYAFMVLLALLVFEGPYLAYGLVILSKWRVFAVRPRFWLANIQTNLTDTVVGLGIVTLIWQASGNLALQIATALFFAGWLVLLKPSSKRFWVVVQAGVAQFVGLTALFSVAYNLPDIVVALIGGVIGYVVARHVIRVYHEELEDVVLSLSWGVVLAELSWLTYFWTVAYTPLKITQIAIVASLLGYMAIVIYNHLYQKEYSEQSPKRDLTLPVAFSLVGIFVLLIFFNYFDPTSL